MIVLNYLVVFYSEIYLISFQICKKGTIDFCEQYGTEEICKKCFEKYILNNEKCVEDVNCESISGANLCTKCKAGYTLFEGLCKPCGANNCFTCEADINTCDEPCPTAFPVFSNPNCVACAAENCLSCVSGEANNCSTCDTGFAVDVNGICQPSSDEKCLKCSAVDTCTSCSDGFGVLSGDCATCEIINCAKCSTSSATCTVCKTGYTLGTSTFKHCYKDINYCVAYTTEGESEFCTSCQNGYELKDNECVFDGCDNNVADNRIGEKCSACIVNYFLTSGYECVQCDKTKCTMGCINAAAECIDRDDMRDIADHCRSYTTDNICIECNSLYTLKDGKCDYNYKECEAITVTGKCTLCHDETTLEYMPSDDFICYVEPEEVSSSSNGNNSTTGDSSSSSNGNDPKDNGAFMNSVVAFFLMTIMLI